MKLRLGNRTVDVRVPYVVIPLGRLGQRAIRLPRDVRLVVVVNGQDGDDLERRVGLHHACAGRLALDARATASHDDVPKTPTRTPVDLDLEPPRPAVLVGRAVTEANSVELDDLIVATADAVPLSGHRRHVFTPFSPFESSTPRGGCGEVRGQVRLLPGEEIVTGLRESWLNTLTLATFRSRCTSLRSGRWIRTTDLQVMGLASYRAAPSR